ncbi:hypothetical protein [Sphingobium boeckii]|uniref:Uncharacterized protein n=1 Tax=Sphingobium boeckii TaxID=1082345 RepID=A0A7W9AG02_9SPHN|nr:hypothetical protein [Sphingobium boeckii]MBB5684998.1 hypothetical protein [Sphingobium boeckii]
MKRRDFITTAAAAATIGGLLTRAGAATMPVAAQSPRLGALRAVTIPAPDLDFIEKAYRTYLGYQTVWRGTVPAETARSWGAPAIAGKRVVVMAPSSGDPTYLRFVEQALPSSYRPLTTYGWNAAELLVADADALGERLKGSPFDIIGAPRMLDGWPTAKAMQVVGPAKEVLYFTHFGPDPKQPELYVPPKAFVDYCFVAIVGTPDMDAAVANYASKFSTTSYGTFDIANIIISNANGLPADTRHKLNTVKLDNGRMIEVDQFPSVAKFRAKPKGGLPPGIALVTFDYTGGDGDLNWVGKAPASTMPPVGGHSTSVLLGTVGEIIEVIRA